MPRTATAAPKFLSSPSEPGALYLSTPGRQNAYVLDVRQAPELVVVKVIDQVTFRAVREEWFWLKGQSAAEAYAVEQARAFGDLQ